MKSNNIFIKAVVGVLLFVVAIISASFGGAKIAFAASWSYPTTTPVSTWTGEGTKESPYIIKTAQQLANLAYYVNNNISTNGKRYSEMHYKLNNNINLNSMYSFSYDAFYSRVAVYVDGSFKCAIDANGKVFATLSGDLETSLRNLGVNLDFWTPIGDGVNTFFSGVFDGNGYSIQGLFYNEYEALNDTNLNNDTSYPHFALFGGVNAFQEGQQAIVKNVKLEKSAIIASGNIAGIVAVAGSSSKIQNSSVDAVISSYGVNKFNGGIAYINSGVIENCYTKGNLVSKNAGGILAINNGTVENCYSSATFVLDDDDSTLDIGKGGICHTNNNILKYCYYFENANYNATYQNNKINICTSLGWFNSANEAIPDNGYSLAYGTNLQDNLQRWVELKFDTNYYYWEVSVLGGFPYLIPVITDIVVSNTEFTYDSLGHTVLITGKKVSDTVKYSRDNVNYGSEVITVTDVTDNPITIYVKISRTGYADYFASATVKINTAYLQYPTIVGEYVFTNEEQTATVDGFVDYAMNISNNKRTAAGVQKICFGLKNTKNTVWEDGSTRDYYLDWEIKKLTGYIYDIDGLDKVYDNTEVSVAQDGYSIIGDGRVVCYYKLKSENDSSYTMVAPKNAGIYTLKLVMQESENYAQVVATKDFIISRKQITKPTVDVELTYNGKLQFVPIETNPAYTILNDSAVEPGVHYVYIVLQDIQNYEWEDGTDGVLTISYKINGAKMSWVVVAIITVVAFIVIELAAIYIYWVVIKKRPIKEFFVKLKRLYITVPVVEQETYSASQEENEQLVNSETNKKPQAEKNNKKNNSGNSKKAGQNSKKHNTNNNK